MRHRILGKGFDSSKVIWLSSHPFFSMIAERSSMCALLINYKIQANKFQQGAIILLMRQFDRVQLLLANYFIDKGNKSQNMIENKQVLSCDDLHNCQKQLFTEVTYNQEQETQKGTTLKSSIADQSNKNGQNKQTACKRIKLKQHFKTEIPNTPQRPSKIRIKTPPNRVEPTSYKFPLGQRNQNLPKEIKRHKANLTDCFPIYEVEPKNPNHFKTLYTELCPSPKKHSLPYTSIHKESVHVRETSKSQERSLSKSKKKIHFTVFETREKSTSKRNIQQKPQIKLPKMQYRVPYRYESTITINLFQEKGSSASKNKEKRSNSKSSVKSVTKNQRPSSLQKSSLTKNLIKSWTDQQSEEKVNQTLQKLEKYKFVGEYIERWQILEKIQGYAKCNQPECKWALLIVDQIFRRIRQDNTFESLVKKS